jgi:hypothetical protein
MYLRRASSACSDSRPGQLYLMYRFADDWLARELLARGVICG